MMAPLLTPAPPNPPGRISQLLPTVKCSNCNCPVPLSELGDHICAAPPPVPSLPKPSVSPAAAASLLPQRLQGRVAPSFPVFSHTPPSNSGRGSSPPQTQEPLPQRLGPPSSERLRINTGASGSASYQARSSPLARPDHDRGDTSSPAGRPHVLAPINGFHTRPPTDVDLHAHTQSNAGSISSSSSVPSPSTPRPSFSSLRHVAPPAHPQPPRMASYTHHSQENEIDTKIGGEAGMAGVGRRGFAAAARAAMFIAPIDRPSGPQLQPVRRANAPRYLDIDTATHSTETPPLSAGSGYSSHSPSVSPFPQSPGSVPRSPSPSGRRGSAPSAQFSHDKTTVIEPSNAPSTSPLSVRMPFFEKYRNQLPGITVPNDNTTSLPNNNSSSVNTPSTATQPHRPQTRESESNSSVSLYSHGPTGRSISISTTASRKDQYDRPPMSPSSGSEYGLAYADSTDYEDDDVDAGSKNARNRADPPPPLELTSSILRSGSNASTSHVRFPSVSDRSERAGTRIPGSKVEVSSEYGRNRSASSASSASSVGGDGGRNGKSNSALIAHALGLSQTPPSAYGRLGGPGVGMAGRSGKSTGGSSSSGSRSNNSRGASSGMVTGATALGSGTMEREMKTLLEDATASAEEQRRVGLSKSKSTGKQLSFGVDSESDSGSRLSAKVLSATAPTNGTKSHRSNTVPGAHSPENRTPKLPTRSRTSPVTERALDVGKEVREKKERPKKARVCLKCERKIEDGRWVQVDGGGVLCENCWKNMYLPKCRRCTLPIEKQAVSSADGQLKGKYHRECFNCHTCHKPFPDKTFYVFDGKPLCAYHYHEANDSLCAAARCGQPIEGPCAVSHTGDRYHPEHMTCEFSGHPPCRERLAEYWDVDGRMLCERHAHAYKAGSDDESEGEWVQSSKAMRRVTRFIDLTGASGPAASGGSSGLV